MTAATCSEHPGLVRTSGDRKREGEHKGTTAVPAFIVNLPCPSTPLSLVATHTNQLFFGVHSQMPSYFFPIGLTADTSLRSVDLTNYGTAFVSLYGLDRAQAKVMKQACRAIGADSLCSFYSFQQVDALTRMTDVLHDQSRVLAVRVPLIQRRGSAAAVNSKNHRTIPFDSDFLRGQAEEIVWLYVECIPFSEAEFSPFASKKQGISAEVPSGSAQLAQSAGAPDVAHKKTSGEIRRVLPKIVARAGLVAIECQPI